MQIAISLYKGGITIAAEEADHSTSKDLGVICPFCKEAVFWVRSHLRGEHQVASSWRHYKMSQNTTYCENRALSSEGQEILRSLQTPAQNQRLKLFNRRFWEIFSYKKDCDRLTQKCLKISDKETLNKVVAHCHKLWDAKAIISIIPERLSCLEKALKNKEQLLSLVSLLSPEQQIESAANQEIVQKMIEDFSNTKYSVLHYKICAEVVAWLGTKSAYPSFEKLIYLSIVDCAESVEAPIHTNAIANMAINSLVITPWEEAIALVDAKGGIGFG